MNAILVRTALAAVLLAGTAIAAHADMDTQARPVTRDINAANQAAHGSNDAAGPQMSYGLTKIMRSLSAAAQAKDWTTAKAKLAEAQALPNPTAFDTFEIDVITAYVDINTADHPGALAAYKKVIANPLFATAQKPAEQAGTLKNAMVLANEAGDYTSAIGFGQKLAGMGAVDDGAAVSLAAAYFGNKQFAQAQSLAQSAIDAETKAGETPNATAVQIVAQAKAQTAAKQ
jgi:hypothetical protein